MQNFKFIITYFHNGMKIVSNLAENEHYKMESEDSGNFSVQKSFRKPK